jgi:branched-subunit amino acid aminotransferase/4-amino-4-deoxychorismate lyase
MQQKPYSILAGKLVLAERAAIPVADRGFRFGDGLFETILIKDGVPYQWALHMDRLAGGLAALRIAAPVEDWVLHARKLLKRNGVKNGFLRIAVSRGVGSRGYAPHPPGMPATWVIETLPPSPAPEKPCQLFLSRLARIPRQCLPVNFKLAQGLNNTLALLEAQDHRCDEALQLTTDGFLCEAASANIFWIRDDVLYTPALDTGCLNGTTREAILRLSPVEIKTVKQGVGALEHAEAIFLSNCRTGIWPVAELAPMGKTFNVKHRLMRQLAGLLRADRIAYVAKHRNQWVKR